VAEIHPTAVVDPAAELGDDVSIGPFCVVGPEARLGDGVRLDAYASVLGRTTVGARTRLHPHACVGGEPQDRVPDGEPQALEIGCDNQIREFATIHVGTERGGGRTVLGDDNLVMNNAHIAHDCRIGSHCIITGPGGLAGHVIVEDYAVLGAFTGVHQFCRVGESAMCAGNAKLRKDAPPFSMVAGDGARVVGINLVGLRRRGFDEETIRTIKHAFHLLFNSRMRFQAAVKRVREEIPESLEVSRLLGFLEESTRGFCR
jgi:UDP-N-acetylglucosamine acyltransferase